MAISPLGNTILVNQMSANASSIQNAHNSRIEFQNMIAQALTNEKDEQILEVRPTEENHEIDPDREHQRQEAQEQEELQHLDHQERDEEDKKTEDSISATFTIDIKV